MAKSGFVCIRESKKASVTAERGNHVTFLCVGPSSGNRRYMDVVPHRARLIGTTLFFELIGMYRDDHVMLNELLKDINDVRDEIDALMNHLQINKA